MGKDCTITGCLTKYVLNYEMYHMFMNFLLMCRYCLLVHTNLIKVYYIVIC